MHVGTNALRTFIVAIIALGSVAFAAGAKAQGDAKPVRVANGTTLDILTIPDVRTFDHYLPTKYGIKAEIEYVPGAVRAIQAVLTDAADIGIATLAAGLQAADKGQDVQ
jgi:ABC-type phosphate/phosphonate transport system substrate-binding protein